MGQEIVMYSHFQHACTVKSATYGTHDYIGCCRINGQAAVIEIPQRGLGAFPGANIVPPAIYQRPISHRKPGETLRLPQGGQHGTRHTPDPGTSGNQRQRDTAQARAGRRADTGRNEQAPGMHPAHGHNPSVVEPYFPRPRANVKVLREEFGVRDGFYGCVSSRCV